MLPQFQYLSITILQQKQYLLFTIMIALLYNLHFNFQSAFAKLLHTNEILLEFVIQITYFLKY